MIYLWHIFKWIRAVYDQLFTLYRNITWIPLVLWNYSYTLVIATYIHFILFFVLLLFYYHFLRRDLLVYTYLVAGGCILSVSLTTMSKYLILNTLS